MADTPWRERSTTNEHAVAEPEREHARETEGLPKRQVFQVNASRLAFVPSRGRREQVSRGGDPFSSRQGCLRHGEALRVGRVWASPAAATRSTWVGEAARDSAATTAICLTSVTGGCIHACSVGGALA